MREPATRILEFLKTHRYARWILLGALIAILVGGGLYLRSQPQDKTASLTDVAAAITAGHVKRIEDAQDSGTLTVYYTDGTEAAARRDKAASFFEQMTYLG